MTTTTAGRPHGYARYKLDGCRCYTCGWARSKYEENRQKQIAAGTWQPWTDAAPVRAHLVRLKAAGIGERRIHELTGVSRTVITGLLRGRRGNPPSERVRPSVAAAILAVADEAPSIAGGANIDGTATARRVRALCRIGWSLTAQATQIGWTVQNYAGLTRPAPVSARTARLVSDLYDRLSMRPATGPSADRARAMAERKGWVPPLEWDDETIGDPATLPASAPGNGPEHLRAWMANYDDLAAMNLGVEEIAVRLRLTPRYVLARVARHAELVRASAASSSGGDSR